MNRILHFNANPIAVAAPESREYEARALWVAKKLCELVRQVKNFAATYPNLDADNDSPERIGRRHLFALTTRRLAADVERLWGLACATPGLSRLNREQLEAEVEEIRALAAGLPRASAPAN